MSFSEIYYFGDSITDSGGIFELTSEAAAQLLAATGIAIPPVPLSPPYAEQFSNGAVYPEIAPALLGIDEDDVFNFSLGGAEALGSLTLEDQLAAALPADLFAVASAVVDPALLAFDTNLDAQVDRFLAQAAEAPPAPGSAASLFIGLNDFNAFAPSSALTAPFELLALVGGILDATLDAARTIAGAGVDTIILNTLPDTSFFPVSNFLPPDLAALVPLADIAVDLLNAGLKLGALGLGLDGIDVEVVDLALITDEIEADLSAFGFQELAQPVLLGAGTSVDPNPALTAPVEQTVFFDLLHPSTNLHGIFAAFTAESLESETVFRGNGDDFVLRFGSDDLILTQDGDDRVFSGGGADVILAGLGDDSVSAGRGSDLVSGGAGDDVIRGNRGDDVLAGADGDDYLYGGSGDDGLIDGLGNDVLDGGRGDDIFLYTESSLVGGPGGDTDLFSGGSGTDTLILALTAESLALEQAAFDAGFTPGQSFTFASLGLTITGIENVVFQEGFGFAFAEGGLPAPSGDLGERLAEADLWGFA